MAPGIRWRERPCAACSVRALRTSYLPAETDQMLSTERTIDLTNPNTLNWESRAAFPAACCIPSFSVC
ncbi:hypothetical protein Y1Q_0011798 [Alligator mississippiensis]|uniref:Uncharacterized protein n=1 Tax=Alligator mississippiensis TaxID=8496 RepID=A0A151M1B5_ALLMI|nr:hypothetical protein Y1Q_0011798 [Alligator mississippiensis]